MLKPAERSEEFMSVRQALERHQKIVVGVVCMVIVGCFVAIYAQVGPGPHPNVHLAYYSDDDGQTWFEDEVFKITPFDHNGHEAVGAMIYSVNGKKSVGYLLRFSEKGREIFARLQPKIAGAASPLQILAPLFADPTLQEVKLSGPAHPWVNLRSRAALAIVTASSGPSGDVEIVNP
jgi:hypothetical protein